MLRECERLGTMVINKPLLILQPQDSLPSYNCVTEKLDCSSGYAGRAVSENYRRAKGSPGPKQFPIFKNSNVIYRITTCLLLIFN